ncbi:MAG: pyrroloquinoline quinone biosynthesis protein PqqB [Candidatus Nitrotoga sp.]
MRVRVLGSSAGGGFPQWNCGCENCRGLREGTIKAIPRTQESVCITADNQEWFLIQASPEIRQQIESFPSLHPRQLRDSPIQAIVLTNGDLDHCLGLLSLRESYPLVVYATERVQQGFIENNSLYRTLERFPNQITWRKLLIGHEIPLLRKNGKPSGLTIEAIVVPGQQPLHLRTQLFDDQEDNVGLKICETSSGQTLLYLSSVKKISPELYKCLPLADCVFFDGTFWSENELLAVDSKGKRAQEMAHIPIGEKDGSLSLLAKLHIPRRIFIHVNNTNPILREDSLERQLVHGAGWQVAYDGMEFEL